MIEDTQWHRVTFYDRLAEIAGDYIKKGRPVYVEGRLKYGKYTDKDGVEKNTVDIIATELQLLGAREGATGSTSSEDQSPSRLSSASNARESVAAKSSTKTGFDDMDDDIPF